LGTVIAVGKIQEVLESIGACDACLCFARGQLHLFRNGSGKPHLLSRFN
jgi:hypothetical protein